MEGALKGGVGVSTLIYASAKSVNCCSCGVVENLWAYTSRFEGNKIRIAYKIKIKGDSVRVSPSLVRDNNPTPITQLVVIRAKS